MSANFVHLRGYDEQLFRLGFLAERYFPEDPNTTLLKLRQLAELLAQQVAARFGVEIRVERALQRILASRSWSRPQRDWLQRIANQTKAITIVDREAVEDDALLFRREGGGWPRLNQLFDGELDGVLQEFQRQVWAA